MTGRILALSMAVVLLAAGAVWADQPGTIEEEIEVLKAPPPPPPAPREKPTTGTIELERWIVAAGLGGNWGSGTVNYDGKSYRIKISGMNILDAGVAHTLDEGDVSNIHDIRDIEGRYRAVDAGLSAIGGAGGMKLINVDNGVEIGVWNVELGVRAGVAPGPTWISLQ